MVGVAVPAAHAGAVTNVALARVVYGNPFSDERAQVIQRLVPGATSEELAFDQEALRRMVEPRLRPYTDADERYAKILTALLAQVKKTS